MGICSGVNDAIRALGSPDNLKLVGVLATIIVAVQGIIGYPLASAFLRVEANRLVKGYKDVSIKWEKSTSVDNASSDAGKKK